MPHKHLGKAISTLLVGALLSLGSPLSQAQADVGSLELPLPRPVSTTPDTPGQVTQSSLATDSSASGARCRDFEFPVTLTRGASTTHQVWGQLCSKSSFKNRTIQVLLHGGSYNHYYWDWPQNPGQYNYVSAATSAGFVTLNIDRLGYGLSDHPFDLPVTFEANAWITHQIISYIRAGALGADFGKVVLVGHSMGGFTTYTTAGRYPNDADAIVVTGATHIMNLPKIATVAAKFYPAALDPKFSGPDWSAINVYTTTLPGTRCETFYNQATVDPNVCTLDEQLKDTVAAGEWASLPIYSQSPTPSDQITVPVLDVIGNNDAFMCVTPSCDSPLSNAPLERSFYPRATSFDLYLQPNSGHMNNLHPSAPQWFAKANSWINAKVGTLTS